MRAQALGPDLAHERRIALGVAERFDLLEQDGAPDVVVIGEAGGQVLLEGGQRVRPTAGPHARDPFVVHIGPDRLPVAVQVTGDGRDRPSPLPQCMSFHVFSSCEHGGGSFGWLA